MFDNAGQDCCARSRILVQRSVYDRFLELLEPAVKGVVGRRPGVEATEMGPLVSARTATPWRPTCPTTRRSPSAARRPTGPGFWFPPTVLLARSAPTAAVTEEIFGPVVTVLPFDDEADAIALANDTVYGLSGSIWTDDLSRAIRVSRGGRSGQPLGQLALVGALHDPVRRLQAIGPRPRARSGRAAAFTETKNVFFAIGELD